MCRMLLVCQALAQKLCLDEFEKGVVVMLAGAFRALLIELRLPYGSL